MSINHFSSPDTLWWNQMDPNNSRAPNSWPFHHHHHHQDPHCHVLLNSQQSASMLLHQSPNPTPTRNFNLNGEDEIETERHLDVLDDMEPMFEKPLTPSDVGKLNRLVIPKQHAERYFPLGGGGESGGGGDKGLLLGFEDESGKAWRFRYSYWNSSQSYVLTKGWSRYVKEKKLDAGDAVLFHRHRTDCERFFIGWRRRNQNSNNNFSAAAAQAQDSSGGGGFYRAQAYPAPFRQQPHDHHAGSIGGGSNNVVPAGSMKRLRLFGVNMECHADESSEPSTPDGSSSTVTNHGGGPNYSYDQQRRYYYSPPDHNYVVGGS